MYVNAKFLDYLYLSHVINNFLSAYKLTKLIHIKKKTKKTTVECAIEFSKKCGWTLILIKSKAYGKIQCISRENHKMGHEIVITTLNSYTTVLLYLSTDSYCISDSSGT